MASEVPLVYGIVAKVVIWWLGLVLVECTMIGSGGG